MPDAHRSTAQPATPDSGRASPRRWVAPFVSVAAILFAAEFAIMSVLPLLGLEGLVENAIDAALLAILALPALYAVGFRPPPLLRPGDLRRYTRFEKRMVGVLLTWVVLVAVVVCVYTLFISEQESSARVINLAGRQRMNIERLVKQQMFEAIESAHTGQTRRSLDERRSDLRQYSARFEQVLRGLAEGDAELGLPRCTSSEAVRQLAVVSEAWKGLRTLLEQLPDRSDMDEAFAQYDALHKSGERVRAEMDQAVDFLETHFAGRLKLVRMVLGLAIVVAVVACVLLAVTFVQMMRRRKKAEQQFRDLVETAPDGMVIIDERGQIVLVNAQTEKLFGYRRQELIGHSVEVLMPERFKRKHHERRARYAARPEARAMGAGIDLYGLRKDGSEFPIELSLSPLKTEDGALVSSTIRDVTNHNKAEEQRVRLLKTEQERNHLGDAVRAHEKVLGVVGHELRTPLASVRAMAEYLLKEEVRGTTEADTFLQSIHDEVIRMAGMVNDLLEVARLNSGTEKWKWSEVRLAEACDAALDSVRGLMDHAKVEIALQVDPPDLVMNGDADAIRRLVLNLLTNAHKNTTEGSIRVHALEMYRENHCWVKLQVSDSGGGIPPEVARQLGTPFALNSGVVGESYVSGSGLGLAICRGIVAAHGGAISVDTAPGQGTSITILMRADLPEPQSGQEPTEITCEVQQ